MFLGLACYFKFRQARQNFINRVLLTSENRDFSTSCVLYKYKYKYKYSLATNANKRQHSKQNESNRTKSMRMVARIRIVATLLVSLAVGPGRVTNAAEKFACPQSQTPPLTLQGKRFYDSSTDQYVPIQGIAYYPRPNAGELASENNHDYLTDDFQTRWEADIATLQTLGVNAVRPGQ